MIFLTCFVVFFFLAVGNVKSESFQLECVCIEGCDGEVSNVGLIRKFSCSYSRENFGERTTQIGGGLLPEKKSIGEPIRHEADNPSHNYSGDGKNASNNDIVHNDLPGWIGGAIVLSFALGFLACQLIFIYRERSAPIKIM